VRLASEWVDLVAGVSFVLALRALSSPKSARRGIFLGVGGMALAVALTWAGRPARADWLIAIGVVAGALVGVPAARRVKMTAMPQKNEEK
jgi:NAD(P) transhydrogenase subunit beta